MITNKFPSCMFSTCVADRENIINGDHFSWSRRCGIDLLLKMLLLYINSIGVRHAPESTIYVDEIKNTSMVSNLRDTAEICDAEKASFICLNRYSPNKHIKLGVFWPIFKAVTLTVHSLPSVLSFIGSECTVNDSLVRLLIKRMDNYVAHVGYRHPYILMTDHHFFSTVIAMNDHVTSAVLQHGLIGDTRFFSPVRATYFFAWSKKSAFLINSEKTVDAGTYKFSKLMKLSPELNVETFADAKRVLLILSSSKTSEQISHRMEPLISLQKRFGFRLLIKMHPGSLFSSDELRAAVSTCDVELYKEEKIETINFDFAFIEQSTAALDVACLGIPFIVIDEAFDSYFSEYKGLLPTACSPDELLRLAVNFSLSKYMPAYMSFLEREIDNGQCRVDSLINHLQSECLQKYGGRYDR